MCHGGDDRGLVRSLQHRAGGTGVCSGVTAAACPLGTSAGGRYGVCLYCVQGLPWPLLLCVCVRGEGGGAVWGVVVAALWAWGMGTHCGADGERKGVRKKVRGECNSSGATE